MACLQEAVGSILRGVCEVKMEITVMDSRRDQILLRGGYFFQEFASALGQWIAETPVNSILVVL